MASTPKILLITLFLVVATLAEGNKEALTAALQSKLNRYRTDLQALQQQVEEVKGELQKVQGKSSFSLATAQEGIANERDLLRSIEGYLTLPFNITSCDCYDLSDRQKERVLKQIEAIRQGLKNLESNTVFEQECSQFQEAKKQLLRQKRYINSIQIALTSKGCGQAPKKQVTVENQTPSGIANIAQSEYQTNLKATNLCYGKLTQEQVKLLWFAFSVKNNVTNCPLATPFYNGAECIACEGETGYFDLSLKKCIAATGVDEDKKCIDAIPKPEGDGDDEDKGDQNKGNETGGVETPATYKDVTVDPLTEDPIVKSVTLTRNKKTIEKIVQPIEGKAVLNKQKNVTDIKYVEVNPDEQDPLVKIRRIRRTSSSSGSSSSRSSGSKSGSRFQEVEPEVSDPEVKIHRVRRTSSSSSSWSSSSGSSSGSSSSSSNNGSSNQHFFEQI